MNTPRAAKPAWNDTVAESGRLRIRHKRRDDALDDYRWRRDPELAQFDGGTPLAASFSEFLRQVEQDLGFADHRRRMFALETPEGLHFGNIMYYNVDAERDSAELGISVAVAAYRGQGLGADAMVTFVRYLWQTLPVRELYLHTLDWNERARRCFQRAGFEETARVVRGEQVFLRMEAKREWWLLWEMEGRFAPPARTPSASEAEVRPS